MPEYIPIAKVKCQKCGWPLMWANRFLGRCKCTRCNLEQAVNFKLDDDPKHMGPIVQIEKPSS